ncbi:MAG: thiamine phosphate synthase [Pseudomonadales bacterium]|nr:thiamine phosphate synthase [Pseudomonadales bacterium]
MKKLSGLYGITDDRLLPQSILADAVEESLIAGCSLIQYRNKSEDWNTQLQQAKSLQTLCQNHLVPLIINDNIDLCLAVNAAGVHLGKQDSSLETAREKLGSEKIIGITCHDSIDAAVAAEKAGADYVAFGSFFPSVTKPQASPAPLEVLTLAKKKLSIPIVAIGGINAENGAALISAGADMLAVISALFKDENVTARTAELVQLFE